MIYSTCTSWEYRTITLIRNNELPSKGWKQRETQRNTEKHRETQRNTEKQREKKRNTEKHRETKRNKEKHRKGNTLNQKPSTV
jgi:hypothetical protein